MTFEEWVRIHFEIESYERLYKFIALRPELRECWDAAIRSERERITNTEEQLSVDDLDAYHALSPESIRNAIGLP